MVVDAEFFGLKVHKQIDVVGFRLGSINLYNFSDDPRVLTETLHKNQIMPEDNIFFPDIERVVIFKQRALHVGDDFSHFFPLNLVLSLLNGISGNPDSIPFCHKVDVEDRRSARTGVGGLHFISIDIRIESKGEAFEESHKGFVAKTLLPFEENDGLLEQRFVDHFIFSGLVVVVHQHSDRLFVFIINCQLICSHPFILNSVDINCPVFQQST